MHDRSVVEQPPREATGAELSAHDLIAVRADRRILDGVSLVVHPGQLVAVAGPSGGGKSTLLEALAGILPVAGGAVRLDGFDVGDDVDRVRADVGFVPQDDIIHRDLPLRATLRHAARLRLARDVDHDLVVDTVLADLGLLHQASTPVGSLSGGQRKRASIAVELLARPRLLLLDEPTAGLDPTTAAGLMRTLRALADSGCTVVVATHNVQDFAVCDAVAVLSKDGRLAYWGDCAGALPHLGQAGQAGQPGQVGCPGHPGHPGKAGASDPVSSPSWSSGRHVDRTQTTAIEQWRVLTRRSAELLAHNRLTVAIMVGAPALVVAMFAVLFTPGTFDALTPLAPVGNEPIMIAYWLAFAGFFFGLTYGLLQICTEVAIARRERFAGVRVGPYLASKVTVLVPVLLAVDLVMLGVLRVLDRLPAMDARTFTALAATILVDAVAALLLGLLISALVTDATHATIALPMVCFPAVLFAGAIQPVADMAIVGQAISVVTPARWAFEGVGDVLQLGDPATGTLTTSAFALSAFALTFTFATMATLRRRLS
jgi:ABC-type multidrug transport system ATPase subunit